MALNAPAPPPPQPRPRRRSLSRHRARTDSNIFDYLDPPDQQHYYHHHATSSDRSGYFVYPEPAPAPQEKSAASGGILKSFVDPLKQLLGRGDNAVEKPPPPPPRHRNDPRRIHSYSGGEHLNPSHNNQQLILAPAPREAEPSAPNKLLALLPSLASIPFPSIPFLTPDPPPQLSQEVVDTMVYYLSLYSQHSKCLHSPQKTKRIRADAERLMLGMSARGVRSLHEYLVGLKRTPDAPIAFDPRMLERHTHGGQAAIEALAKSLGGLLIGLAGVLEGGFTVPGGWVDGE